MTTNTLFMNATIKNYFIGLCLTFLCMPGTMNAESFIAAQTTDNLSDLAETMQYPNPSTRTPVKILNVSMLNIGGCNHQDTETEGDDTYIGLVTITFDDMPTSGELKISGATHYQLDFEADNDGQSAFSLVLELPANGQKVELLVKYIGNEESSFLYESQIIAEEGCSARTK